MLSLLKLSLPVFACLRTDWLLNIVIFVFSSAVFDLFNWD